MRSLLWAAMMVHEEEQANEQLRDEAYLKYFRELTAHSYETKKYLKDHPPPEGFWDWHAKKRRKMSKL